MNSLRSGASVYHSLTTAPYSVAGSSKGLSQVQPATVNQEPRSDPRAHVFLMAVLCSGLKSTPVRVRNISAHGALLEGKDLPAEQRTVSLKRGSLATAGQIAWSKGQQCGIRFSGPIEVAEWVDRAGPVGQQRIDATVAEFKNGVKPNADRLARSRQRDREALLDVSDDLLRVCERLAALPDMSIALAEELIRIEAAAIAVADIARSPL